MGAFVRVWVPDYLREAMDWEINEGPLSNDEELVGAALHELLGLAPRTTEGEGGSAHA